MPVEIRKENPADYRAVENLTREAFWGCMDHPTCDGEHLLVHKLRKLPCFVPELDLVAETDGKIVGHIIYSLAKVVTPEGLEIPVLSFGPLSVHPDYKRQGIGSALMRHSIRQAARLGYRAILIYGHPDYYPRFGFRRASSYGITSADGSTPDALMAMELYDNALEGITGRFFEDAVYAVDPEETAEFDKNFAPKEPARLLTADCLTEHLPVQARQAFQAHGIRYVGQLHRYSGREILEWEGMNEQSLALLNELLAQMGLPCKLPPSSYIFALTEMGLPIPSCSLLRSKAGISLYRVETEGKRLILKVFEKQEDTREIENYRILSSLGIPTLPLLGCTQNAILLPEVGDGSENEAISPQNHFTGTTFTVDAANPKLNTANYRLGREDDLFNPQAARAIARWYKTLHAKGREYLSGNAISLYDESDSLTLDTLKQVAEKTGTTDHTLWQETARHFDRIRDRISALPRTLTYNDFYWTNLIVSKDQESAFMFDYNLLGKGTAYGDIRNVTSSLSPDAAQAFLEEYGMDFAEEERKADAFLGPLVTLVSACKQEKLPSWAEESLDALRNGKILLALREWLGEL